jgi:hypothetical protein
MTAPSSAQTEPLGSNELSNENVVKTHSRSIPNALETMRLNIREGGLP